MKSKNRFLAALDIGTDTVKVSVVDLTYNSADPSSMFIAAAGQSQSKGLRKGVVINIDYTVQAIKEALAQAESLLGDEISEVLLSISGSHLHGINSDGVVGIKYGEITPADLDRVFEAARAIAIPFDREVVHVMPQDFIVDGQKGIKKPVGISGVRLETTVHIVTGSTNVAQNLIKCANRCGLTVKDLILSGIASAHAVTSSEEREQGVCLIDIGAGTSDLCLFYNGSVRHTAVIPLGGGHITNDLAAGLRTPIASAEKIKREYAFAYNSGLIGNQRVEIKALGDHANKVVAQSDLVKIIQPRLTEMFEAMNAEIDKSQLRQFLTAGVVLTGGTANMHGIQKLAEDIFQMPVRIAAPRKVQGLSDFVCSPEYSTSLGLLSYSMSGVGTQSSAVNRDNAVKKYFKRVGSWFHEHF